LVFHGIFHSDEAFSAAHAVGVWQGKQRKMNGKEANAARGVLEMLMKQKTLSG
jgi:hypothetical protein